MGDSKDLATVLTPRRRHAFLRVSLVGILCVCDEVILGNQQIEFG